MRNHRAREIQSHIRTVLLENWDPIRVAGIPEAKDEYDSYIGPIYRLLANGVSVEHLAQHLRQVEAASMGLSSRGIEGHLEVARKLKALSVGLGPA